MSANVLIAKYNSSKCCYKGCENGRFKTRGVKLFRFPVENVDVWFKNIGNPQLVGITKELLERRTLRVCEQHFRPEDILPSGRLMHGAVPLPCKDEIDFIVDEWKAKNKEKKGSEENIHHDEYDDLNVNKTQHPRIYKNLTLPESMLSASRKGEKTDSTLSETLSRVDNEVASQLDYNSMSSCMAKARKLAKHPEMESHQGPGPSNIESLPCSSTSKIQFEASEVTTLKFVDPEFGTLEQSGMGSFVPTPPVAQSVGNQDAGNEKENKDKKNEIEASANTSTDVILTTQSNNDNELVSKSSVIAESRVTESVCGSQSTATVNETELKNTRGQNADLYKKETNAKIRMAIMSQKRLDDVVNKLENVSKKLAAASLVDSYDEFGKYISALLRGLPTKRVTTLKTKLVLEVLKFMHEEERESQCKNVKSIGVQVGLDVLDSEKSYKKFLKEQTQLGKSRVPADAKSLASNIPVLSGNLPLVFPGSSTSNSSGRGMLLPLIPMSAASPMVSSATVVTPSFVGGSVASLQTLPLSCETVTTVAKSADGTLLAVTIPKPQMTEALLGSDQSSLQSSVVQTSLQSLTVQTSIQSPIAQTSVQPMPVQSPRKQTSLLLTRGQKRKQVPLKQKYSEVHVTKKQQTEGYKKSQDDISDSGGGEKLSSSKKSQDDIRDSGGDELSSTNYSSQQTEAFKKSQDDIGNSGGGEELSSTNQSSKNEEHEFEMDFEDGCELAQIKQDQDFFESVLCDESPRIYIKEEAPDSEELHSPPAVNPLTSAPLSCSLCDTQCEDRDEIIRHFSTTHFGNEPSAKDASGGSYFVT